MAKPKPRQPSHQHDWKWQRTEYKGGKQIEHWKCGCGQTRTDEYPDRR